MADTFGNLITRIETQMSLLGGLDVQVYAQPKIAEKLQQKFDVLFDRRWWKDFRLTSTWALDGSTGLITTNVSSLIKRYTDIQHVWLDSGANPLPEAPSDINPSVISAPCIEAYADEDHGYFRILPVTTTGDVTVRYRTKPDAFTETDVVPFDDHVLIAAVCADFLNDEGANLKAAEKFAKIASERLNQLEMFENSKEKSMYGVATPDTNMWRDR